jgi:hypothetical protein
MKEIGNKLRVKDTKTFIEKANQIHKGIYLYTNSEYINQNNVICITCIKHGNFWQKPKLHLKKHGCSKCGDEYRGQLNSNDTSYFIKKATLKYKNFFDYSKVQYISNSINIEIICPLHGSFLQTPNNHLSGHGCKMCNGYKSFNTKTFIEKANSIFNYTYNYSKVNYISSHKKVIIICNKHGQFVQKPNTHLNGIGCPVCRESKGERELRKIFEEYEINFKSQYRINECRNILPLPFDFAIFNKENNLVGLIEFQGAQHFILGSFGSKKLKKNTLDEIIKRDNIKLNYCKQNGIPLLIIPYFKKNLKDQILNFVKLMK